MTLKFTSSSSLTVRNYQKYNLNFDKGGKAVKKTVQPQEIPVKDQLMCYYCGRRGKIHHRYISATSSHSRYSISSLFSTKFDLQTFSLFPHSKSFSHSQISHVIISGQSACVPCSTNIDSDL